MVLFCNKMHVMKKPTTALDLIRNLQEVGKQLTKVANAQDNLNRLVDQMKPMPQGIKDKLFGNHPVPVAYIERLRYLFDLLTNLEKVDADCVDLNNGQLFKFDHDNEKANPNKFSTIAEFLTDNYYRYNGSEDLGEAFFEFNLNDLMHIHSATKEIIEETMDGEEAEPGDLTVLEVALNIRELAENATTDYNIVKQTGMTTGSMMMSTVGEQLNRFNDEANDCTYRAIGKVREEIEAAAS